MKKIFLLAAILILLPLSAYAGYSNAVFAFSHNTSDPVLILTDTASNQYRISVNAGWINEIGSSNGGGSNNWITGVCGSSDSCGGSDLNYNSFYTFDVPVGVVFSAATLVSPVDSNGVISQNSTVPFTMYDYTGLISALATGSVAAFNDLGSGDVYGSRLFSSADNGTTVSIALNAAALADINAAAGSQFALGASVSAVPIPAAFWLLGSGLLGLIGYRRKFRS